MTSDFMQGLQQIINEPNLSKNKKTSENNYQNQGFIFGETGQYAARNPSNNNNGVVTDFNMMSNISKSQQQPQQQSRLISQPSLNMAQPMSSSSSSSQGIALPSPIAQPSPSTIAQPSPSSIAQPSPSTIAQPSPSSGIAQPSPSSIAQPSPSSGIAQPSTNIAQPSPSTISQPSPSNSIAQPSPSSQPGMNSMGIHRQNTPIALPGNLNQETSKPPSKPLPSSAYHVKDAYTNSWIKEENNKLAPKKEIRRPPPPKKKMTMGRALTIEQFNQKFLQYEHVFINGKDIHRDYTWWAGWIEKLPTEDDPRVQVRFLWTKEYTYTTINKIKKFDLLEAKELLNRRYSNDSPTLLEDILHGLRLAIQEYTVLCDSCNEVGSLLVCDGHKCTKVIHQKCVSPIFEQSPNIDSNESWLCNDCEEKVEDTPFTELDFTPINFWKLLWNLKHEKADLDTMKRDLLLFKDDRATQIRLDGGWDHPQSKRVTEAIDIAEKRIEETFKLFDKRKNIHEPTQREFDVIMHIDKNLRDFKLVGIPGVVIERKKRLESAQKRKRDKLLQRNLENQRSKQRRKLNPYVEYILEDEEEEEDNHQHVENDTDFIQLELPSADDYEIDTSSPRDDHSNQRRRRKPKKKKPHSKKSYTKKPLYTPSSTTTLTSAPPSTSTNTNNTIAPPPINNTMQNLSSYTDYNQLPNTTNQRMNTTIQQPPQTYNLNQNMTNLHQNNTNLPIQNYNVFGNLQFNNNNNYDNYFQ